MYIDLTYQSWNRKALNVEIDVDINDLSFTIEHVKINSKKWDVNKITSDSIDRLYELISHLFNIKKEVADRSESEDYFPDQLKERY